MFAARYDPLQSRKRSYSSSSSESESEAETESVNTVPKQDPQSPTHSDTKVAEESSDEASSDFNSGEISQDKSESDKIDGDDSDGSSSGSSIIKEDEKDEKENDNDEDKDESTNDEEDNQDSNQKKFSSIFKRLKTSITKSERLPPSAEPEVDADIESEENAIKAKDLAPIPQPQLPKDKQLNIQNNTQGSLNWVARPVYYASSTTRPFAEYEIFKQDPSKKQLLQNLQSNSYNDAFSVQVAVFNELVLQKREYFGRIHPDNNNGDLLVNAATGSGKTLSYLVPILLDLSHRVVPKLSCIILVPTRTLVNQILNSINALNKNLNLNVVASNSNVAIRKEMLKFQNYKPDILITTPGRLVDYLTFTDGDENEFEDDLNNDDTTLNSSEILVTKKKQEEKIKPLNLRYLKYIVIDEVDRLLNQSFQNWITIINTKLQQQQHQPNNKLSSLGFNAQKLLFSATLHNDVNKLSSLNFYKPKLLIVDDEKFNGYVNATGTDNGNVSLYKVPEKLREFEVFVSLNLESFKPLLLLKLLLEQKLNKNILIFTRSNESSMRLTKLLSLLLSQFQSFHNSINSGSRESIVPDISFQYLNSTLSTNDRKKTLNRFAKQQIHVLVATDLVSRGIDLLNIEKVINYDLPMSSAEYVHRVGRCARASNYGEAITFIVGNGARKWFNKITRDISRNSKIDKLSLGDADAENVDVDGYRDGQADKLSVTELEKTFYNNALQKLEEAVRAGN